MQIAILVFPGSNCERETMLAVRRAGMTPVEVRWNESIATLGDFQGYILAGGFSYEDRGRAGVIAANLPILEALKMQSQLGKPILGICNGAQILVESGLVPGPPHEKIAITDNKRMQDGKVVGTGFYNAWVHLISAVHTPTNAFTRFLAPDSVLTLPIAHAQGRFLLPDAVHAPFQNGAFACLQYCDAEGTVEASFPTNPNGSTYNIAALCNEAGNVMAIMPHPERTPNGDCLFQSMRAYIASGYSIPKISLPTKSVSQIPDLPTYKKPQDAHERTVALMITDNHAFTLEKTLQNIGIPVKLTRQLHWEITCNSEATLQQILDSGALYNDKKERLITPYSTSRRHSFLVHPKEDLQGLEKTQFLQKHFDIGNPLSIKRSILWHVETENPAELACLTARVLHSSLLWNPVSETCNHYAAV